jgi:hypothetical protein
MCYVQVSGPPKFLHPEATRQQKVCHAHLQSNPAHLAKESQPSDAGKPYDIARLAPKLKGTQDIGQSVLSAPAKRVRESKAELESAYGNSALVCITRICHRCVCGCSCRGFSCNQHCDDKRLASPMP